MHEYEPQPAVPCLLLSIAAGAFFLINLALAVLYLQFTKEFSVSPSASAAVTRSTSMAAGAASLKLADLQAEPSEQHHAQMTADDYDDEFAELPAYGVAAFVKQAASRADAKLSEAEGVGSNSVRGSTSVGRQTRFQTKEVVAAGDAFVTAEVVLTSRPPGPITGQQQQQQHPQNAGLVKALKQGVHYSDGHQSPRVRLQQQQQQHQQQCQQHQPSQGRRCCSQVWNGIRQACRTAIEVLC
jgi:hypothetical protein